MRIPSTYKPAWWLWLAVVAASLVLAWLVDNFGALGAIVGVGGAFAVWLGAAILRTPQLGLWFILFFLPFERIPSLDIGGVTLRLNFFFGAVTMLSLLGAWAFGRLKGRPNPIAWPLIAYLIAATLSFGVALELQRSLQVFLFTVFTMGFTLLVINLLRTPADLRKAIGILLASAAVVGVFGIYQFLGDAVGLPLSLTGLDQGYSLAVLGFPRIQAFSVEPLYLGNYLLLPLALIVSLLMLRTKEWPRLPLWLLFALLSLVLVLTVSRGAYLGAGVTVLVLILTLPRQIFTPPHLAAGMVLLALVGIGTGIFLSQGREDALEQFQEHVTIGDLEEGESTQGRLSAFDIAVQAWEDHPVTGIGLGNFGAYVKGYPDPRDLEGYDIVNNEYLEVLAETGILGAGALAVGLAILLSRSIIAYKQARDPLLRAAILGSTAAFFGVLAQYNFFSTLFIIHIWVLVGFMVATQNLALVPEKASA